MKRLLGLLILLVLCFKLNAQRAQIENLPSFDERRFHFGFMLGYNNSSLLADYNQAHYDTASTLLGVAINRRPGFNLGIISSLNITKNTKLRFIPSLSFQERTVDYTYTLADSSETLTEPLESTFLDFPLNFKFRTNRANNFAAYALIGGKFSIDMASRKDVSGEDVLKINRLDYAYEVGGGMDFFLQYFKFGLELKLCMGIPNVLIQENNRLSSPFSSLKTQAWMFSITFEG